MLSLYVYETIPFHRMVNFHFPMVEIPLPCISSPKTQSNTLFCFSILMFTSVQSLVSDLKPMIDEEPCPQIWACFWARLRNKIPKGNCDYISTKCFINVNLSYWSIDCPAKNLKPRKPLVILQDQCGDWPSKSWANLHFSSYSAQILAFSSQYHMIWS